MSQKSLPPLNWLRAFEVAARHLSFTQAAQELNLTQGAISQQIRQLESHLGSPLFVRLSRGLELTQEGQSFLPVVQEAIARLAVGTSEIFGRHKKTRLNLSGSLSFFQLWLTPKIADFLHRHPAIDFTYNSTLWVGDLSLEDDLEIRWGGGQWAGVIAQRLTRDWLFPVCSPDYLRQRPLTDPKELEKHTLLHVIGYEEGWGYWLKKCGQDKIEPSKGIKLDTSLSTISLAEAGVGIALARSSLVRDALNKGTLISPFNYKVEASESFYLAWRENKQRSPAALAFCQWITGYIDS